MQITRPTAVVVTMAALLGGAFAAWQTDPAVNLPLCTQGESQTRISIAPDGDDGFVAAWQDYRSDSGNIYAQRVSHDGSALWTADGVVVCDESHPQWHPAIAPDGVGGVIAVWEDRRDGAPNIFAQRLDPSGARSWTGDGVAVVIADDAQEDPQVIPDGAGGAIVVWVDERFQSRPDIFAQRIDANGTPQWAAAGVAICTAVDDQYDPLVVTDGAGGAIVAWEDGRPGGVYLQHLRATGTVGWATDGVPVSSTGGYRSEHALTNDDFGGAIVAWTDDTLGGRDIYAQRFDPDGNALWAANGMVVCTEGSQQDDPSVCPDCAGGAIVAWVDDRGPDRDIYAQRVDAGGDALWTLDGVPVCTAAESQATVQLVTDGVGGAILSWRDWRDSAAKVGEDLYAQRLDAAGAPLWTAEGHAVCTADRSQQGQVMLFGGSGVAFVAWEDRRDQLTTQQKDDVYAQLVDGVGGGNGGATTCTIGSYIEVQGAGFGTAKKPRVYVLYEKKPGKQKAASMKVRSWSDTSIQATWKKRVPLDTYAVWVKPKGGQPGQFGEVTVVGPTLDPGQVLAGAPKAPLMLAGTHFGTKQGKVLVEYVNAKGKTKRKRCKLQKKSWVMDPDTGVSSVGFFVPKLPAGTYDLFLAGKLGEVGTHLTIQ